MIRWISNYTCNWDEMMKTALFTLMNHRINNTGWMMKWQWNGGVERKANPLLRECWTFLIYIFLHQQWKQCLEFALTKLREICTCFGWCLQFNQSCPWATLSYFCLQNKEGKTNATRRVVLRKYTKRAQRYLFALKCEEVPANWIQFICRQKTTTSLWNSDRKGK